MSEKCLFDVLKNYGFEIDENFIKEYHIETVNHVIRCFEMAREFGLYLGLNEEELDLLGKCALLHDIGKFQLDKNILYKVDKLSDEEIVHIKSHTELKNIDDIKSVEGIILDSIKYHHDNFICTGYNKINVGEKHCFVRIISIIDAFDAMTYKRCYAKRSLTYGEALKEIFKHLGKQFDLFYGNEFIKFIKSNNYMDIKVIIIWI